jgi:hypothetical protein
MQIHAANKRARGNCALEIMLHRSNYNSVMLTIFRLPDRVNYDICFMKRMSCILRRENTKAGFFSTPCPADEKKKIH